MDVSQYLEIFIDESNEHLQSLSDQLMILEKEPENSDTINEIFRAAHSLKGMAGTMGYKRMQNLTHDMENVFSEVRNGNIKVTSDMCDVLFQCLDALESYVTNIRMKVQMIMSLLLKHLTHLSVVTKKKARKHQQLRRQQHQQRVRVHQNLHLQTLR